MIVNMVAPWGTKYHYMSGIHTNVTTVQLPSGQAWYSYLWNKPQNGGNDSVNCVSVPSAVTVSGWREGGIGSVSAIEMFVRRAKAVWSRGGRNLTKKE
jgi:hypothetical protein